MTTPLKYAILFLATFSLPNCVMEDDYAFENDSFDDSSDSNTTDTVILAIHSNGKSSFYNPLQTVNGHAWITIYYSNREVSYGLWPDTDDKVIDSGQQDNQSDVRVNIERDNGYTPKASRYYEITTEQLVEFRSLAFDAHEWELSYNCSSWVSQIASQMFDENISASDSVWDNPYAFEINIDKKEDSNDTSLDNPIPAQ